MKKQAEKWIKKGFRYAYTIREGQTLQDAFDARFVTTSEQAAHDEANRKLMINESDRVVQVYNLKTIK